MLISCSDFIKNHHSNILKCIFFGYVNFLRRKGNEIWRKVKKFVTIFVFVYNKLSSLDPGMLVWRSPKITFCMARAEKSFFIFFLLSLSLCNSTEIYGIQSVCRTDTITHIPYIGNGNSTNNACGKRREKKKKHTQLILNIIHACASFPSMI